MSPGVRQLLIEFLPCPSLPGCACAQRGDAAWERYRLREYLRDAQNDLRATYDWCVPGGRRAERLQWG